MSFDYVLDLFGEFRKGKKTRFTDVETTAKDLLDKFVKGEISNKDFADGFVSVGKRFTELMDNGNETVFDEDIPLWLNSLLGLHFVEWLRFQRIEQYFQEHPEELVGERVAVFEELKERQYTEKFKDVCANVISELEK